MAALFGKKDNEKKDKSEKDNVLDMVQDGGAAKKDSKESKSAAASKDNTGNAYKVLVRPLVSEKSYSASGQGQYIFIVNKSANKIEVRKAVEKVYDVKVTRVNILNVRGKARAFGSARGRTSDWKKAIVTLKKGQTIGEAVA